MNPAFSVILFTTLSGTGFGLWFWLSLRIALGGTAQGFKGMGWALGLIAGGALVAGGVIASLWHLGKPRRVWRAFSQWRSSWMSREGVFALAAMATAAATLLVLSSLVQLPDEALVLRGLCALLALLCIAALCSTAMIYGSLKTVPAWRHPLVLPGYLLFALVGGGLLVGPFAADAPHAKGAVAAALLAGAALLAALKLRYWRDIDRDDGLPARGDAVGLPGRDVRTFERPATEAAYLQREMGFVLARRHARKLRRIAVVLFAVVPAVCTLVVLLRPQPTGDIPTAFAAIGLLLGAMVERWLFFAEARHVVTLYD